MKRIDGGYAICKKEYLSGSSSNVERYYDENGKAVSSVGGFAGKRKLYDGDGQLIGLIYYDKEGNEIGGAWEGIATEDQCLKYYERTCGATKEGYGTVAFETGIKDNAINAVWFQLYNAATGEYLFNFGPAYGIGEVQDEYIHELPSGIYRLVFKVNTNLKDESISSVEYLTEGETLDYGYSVEVFQDKKVRIQGFHIDRRN